jgi:hypothetical protein
LPAHPHQHVDVLLRVEQVAEVVLAHLELDSVDLARERAVLDVALGSDGRSGLTADINAFVGREDDGCVVPTLPSPTFSPS